MRISDWSSDVCSSDLRIERPEIPFRYNVRWRRKRIGRNIVIRVTQVIGCEIHCRCKDDQEYTEPEAILRRVVRMEGNGVLGSLHIDTRSEEHTSELQSLMRISYAVFCLKKNN